MLQKKVPIYYEDPKSNLYAFLPEGEQKPVVLVLPGGAYEFCAEQEGQPVAERFAWLGYAAFVLNYSTAASGGSFAVFPKPLRQVAETIFHIRANAGNYGINPRRLAVVGASAGGHLAACYANEWNKPAVFGGIGEAEDVRPNATVLLYPATELRGEGRMESVILGHGAPFTEEELRRYTPRYHLGTHTPPAVFFHSAPDPTVPVSDSLSLFLAMQARDIPSELHIFGDGEHAYGDAAGTRLSIWPSLAATFLKAVLDHPETFLKETARLQREERHRKLAEAQAAADAAARNLRYSAR